MSRVLETFEKQPGETRYYDISFVDWLAKVGDAGASVTGSAETGLTLSATTLATGVARIWVSGGTTGTKYKVTVRLTTTAGQIKEVDVYVKVKEV